MGAGLIPENDTDIYTYGLELLISTLGNIFSLLALGLIFNRLVDTLFLIAVLLPLQSFAGAYHADTHIRCFLIMMLGWFPVMWAIDMFNEITVIGLSAVSAVLIFRWAPLRHSNVPMSAERVVLMRRISRWITSAVFIISVVFMLFGYPVNRFGIVIATALIVLAVSMTAARVKNAFSVEAVLRRQK